jgi:shikimate kinase
LKKNLILTGMMGVGKSSIGKSVSERLNMNFIDIDKVIEKKEANTIRNIFQIKGEKYFRILEKEITIKYLSEKKSVIALGGGAFINNDIRAEVLNQCVSFWLDASIETLLRRSFDINKRPLLNKGNLENNLRTIYEERKETYKLANYKINCDTDKKSLIVNEIIKIYEI